MFDLELLHNKSIYNKAEVLASDKAGCFYCLHIHEPSKVEYETCDKNTTVLCPKCGIDSVLAYNPQMGSMKDFSELLEQMYKRWFTRG